MAKVYYPPPQIIPVQPPPEAPADAKRKVTENVEVFTMTEISEEEEQQLRADLAEMLSR